LAKLLVIHRGLATQPTAPFVRFSLLAESPWIITRGFPRVCIRDGGAAIGVAAGFPVIAKALLRFLI
jgi:hypothetical protein